LDLRFTPEQPTEAERSAVDSVVGPGSPGGSEPMSARAAGALRHLLLPVLHALRARVGWLSPAGLAYACSRLSVPPAEAFGVASFYALLPTRPVPPVLVHVCDDLACRVAQAEVLCAKLENTLGPAIESRGADGAVAPSGWMRSPCLGLCERAPAVLLTVTGDAPSEQAFGPATATSVREALAARTVPDDTAADCIRVDASSPHTRLLARAGRVDVSSIDDYRSKGGYEALRRALDSGPVATLREITEAGLAGRGGAAFPTGRKWEAVARAPQRPRYVVCNADESEPGTFKDRVLMELDPFAVIEAITVAGVTVGAERGFLYVRAEYPRAHARLEHAAHTARTHGCLGTNIMDRGVAFDVEIRRGAGAYICGEETALFNSIEGLRGEPRSKPPFPTQEGLFGKPTLVNNVETLVAALDVVRFGAAWHRSEGTATSTGTKLFCVSGSVVRPGVYERPFGTPLDTLVADAGGVRDGRSIRAVLLGGAAGTFLGPDQLSVRLSFEDTQRIGATLGSGVVMVFDDGVDLQPIVARIARFFRDESCGQCVPCRVGTARVDELVERMMHDKLLGSASDEVSLLNELSQTMRDASICGLGQTATAAIESAVHRLNVFPAMRRS